MSYPTLERYNEALQHPQTALIDPELRRGTVVTTGLGLPLALCGGFALTYTLEVGQAKFAVRCFHKQSHALEQRYRAISGRLRALRSPHFLDFEFQARGIRVDGDLFPLVKMTWAAGKTLGEFLEEFHADKNVLRQVRASLRALAALLESERLAHGDVQPGNVMVSDGGRSLQLIDYDGMFVEALASLGGAELGHRNFQHPQRAAGAWDARLDRFSFIALHCALLALETQPALWRQTQSDGDAVLFKANDYADPARSHLFDRLFGQPHCADDARRFAAVCQADFAAVPTLEDFLAGKNVPRVATPRSVAAPARYLSAFPVLNAAHYAICRPYVGDRVELVGKIVEVKQAKTSQGRPYVFINFGHWRGHIVKISIWHQGLSALAHRPDAGWIGRWISAVGLLEPPYQNPKFLYSHLSISIIRANQLHLISEAEALFRLGDARSPDAGSLPSDTNREVLREMRGGRAMSARPTTSSRARVTANQTTLRAMKGNPPPAPVASPAHQPAGNARSSTPATRACNTQHCFIASAVYGPQAPETLALRLWRDRTLGRSWIGRRLVDGYYALAPRLVPLIERNRGLEAFIRRCLDRLLAYL
ncbi:MAG: serine/threonine protein kinase [bacterium]|nr:serine/threonine protein kinase [bacterium]